MKRKIYYITTLQHDFWGYPNCIQVRTCMGIDSLGKYVRGRRLRFFPLASDFSMSQDSYKEAFEKALDEAYDYILVLAKTYAKRLKNRGIVYEMNRTSANRIEIAYQEEITWNDQRLKNK